NSKRKIDFITITSPIEKKLKNNVKSNFENYRLFDDESGNEQLTKAQDSIQQYIKTFGKIVDDPDAYEISLKKLTNIIDNIKTNSSSFIKTTSFVKFFTSFNDDLIEKANSSSNIAITINNDLLKELQRFSISLKKNDQSNNVQFNRKIQQKINNLTIKLKKINEDIHKYQSRSLTLDEMNDHTVFTKLPRLQKLAIRIWQQRELLLNRSTDTGLQLYRKFVYNGDDNIINHHPQLKQIVENFVNNHLNSLKNAEHELIQQQQSRKLQKRKKDFLQLPMFTILDLKQSILSKLNDEKIDNFQLTDNIVTKIYKNLIEEMTKRHNAQQRECIDNYYLLDYDDNCSNDDETLITNENDPELIEQLEQNSIVSKNAMEKLINEYKKKDLEKNGKQNDNDDDNSRPLGWDDHTDDEDKDSDDDADDDTDDTNDENDNDSDTIDDDDSNSVDK
uniref:Probable ATP-dependent helicase PF08_0048 n=1 Tax=Dermatophagoides pteronyssinus TaxID=6956 RepID=A0A6P6YH88_DERPT